MKGVERAAALLKASTRLCVFTGAGVSAESGIATFRDEGGFWERYPMRDFGTPGGLARIGLSQPERLVDFLLDLLEPVSSAAPNPAHRAIAALEGQRRVTVVTQNVDGLHQTAGSDEVHEVHGSLFQIVDAAGAPLKRLRAREVERMVADLKKAKNGRFLAGMRAMSAIKPLIAFGPSGLKHRPNVVLFGEAMAEPAWSRAHHAVARCDGMIVVGTSGTVYPAAELPDQARERGVPIVGVGPEEGDADLWLSGRAGDVLPALVEAMAA